MKASALARAFAQVWQQEDINFLLTNRVPRIALTRFMGWVSQIRSARLARWSIWIWRRFTELDLSDAAGTRFDSLQACFTRALKPGSRTIDPDPGVLVSPSDGIVGACGEVRDGQSFQAKGMPYALTDLFAGDALAQAYRDGLYVTLRLTSGMYHRFHAPCAARVRQVTYISGDTWNVNPIALARVQRLFCRNERALIPLQLPGGALVTLVPVAAVLVASIRLHFLDVLLHLKYRGPHRLACDTRVDRGQELGWFQHGSTILVFAPRGFALAPGIAPGRHVRMGERLLLCPGADEDTALSRAEVTIPAHAA